MGGELVAAVCAGVGAVGGLVDGVVGGAMCGVGWADEVGGFGGALGAL